MGAFQIVPYGGVTHSAGGECEAWGRRVETHIPVTLSTMGGHMALSIQLDKNPDHWVVTLQGDLDYSECATFRMTIDKILKNLPPATIVDLSGLDYLDSSGLGLLLSLSKEYGAQGGRLVLVTNESVNSILDLTRLSGLFSTVGTIEQAKEMVTDLAVE